jgi:cellobiose phosphorylase
MVKAHAYWRLHGLISDLVIIDQEAVGYVQPLQEQLRRIVDGFGHFTEIDKPGGVFLRAGRQMAAEDLNLLLSASRIVLIAARGSLAQQLGAISQTHAPQPPPRKPAEKAQDFVSGQLPFQELKSFNGLGGFFADDKEYSIYMGEGDVTPAPWVNVMANKSFGALVSETGSGTMWYGNSQSNRITPWSNDAVLDPSGDAIYIWDENLDVYWTPTPTPIRENDPYRARHGQGYSIFEHNSHGIDQVLTIFVPLDHAGGDPLKVQILTLRNCTQTTRKLAVTPYLEWVLGTTKEETQSGIITSFDTNSRILFAHNSFNPDYSERVAFLAMTPKPDTYTGDRTDFIGRCGSTSNPGAIGAAGLFNRVGAALDPCGAVQARFEIRPSETVTIVVLTGEATSEDDAARLIAKYATPELAEASLRRTQQEWDKILGAVQVQTPEAGINALLNRWLLYQTISCRIWGRTGFYQSSGAYGFRDQLQDVQAVLLTDPMIAKQQILRAAGRQFIQGDVQHWWHPITGAGTRTRISDDLLWLPYIVAQYVRITGDQTILDETVPFIEGAVLAPDEHERFFIPDVSTLTGSIMEHCIRAVNKGLTSGPHGLPLIGGGDWNDGLNRVGVHGTGESTWLAWFLVHVLNDPGRLLQREGSSHQ